jgi:hypothetical protein
MAIGINIPQTQARSSGGGMTNRLMTLGGLAAGAAATVGTGGAAAPGAMAIMQGAAAGGGLGSMAGSIMNPEKQSQAATPTAAGSNGAVDRRLGQLDQSPLRQIRESIKSLEHVPDQNLRAQLAQPLFQAAQAAKRKV